MTAKSILLHGEVMAVQEEIEQKSFNIMISTTKLSARTVLRAVKAAFRLYQSKASQGKQSVRTLLRQNRGVSSVEISKTGIRGLERYAKKYGIDYAIRKDTSEVPPRYLVFFKAPDSETFNSAFKEYSASLLNKDKRPSVLARLQELVQAAAELPRQSPAQGTGAWTVTTKKADKAAGTVSALYPVGAGGNQLW